MRSTEYGRVKRLSWDPSYVDADRIFPAAVTEGIFHKDWDQWDDPFHMNYRHYVEVQAKKESTFHPTRESFARYQGVDRIDPRWAEGMKILYPYLVGAEYAANRSHGRVSRYCPAPALREASFYQSIDELRHAQNHLYQVRLLNQTMPGFDNWAYWRSNHFLLRPAVAGFEDLVSCDNIFEAIIGLNLCAEVGLTNLIFISLPAAAVLNGDECLAQEFLTTQSDETRHMAIGQSTVRTLLQSDPRNVEKLQYWFDKWFWLQHRAIAGPVAMLLDYFARRKTISAKEAYDRYIVQNFIGGLVEDLGTFGFRPPKFLDDAVTEMEDVSHSLFRSLFQYKHVLFNKVFVPLDSDLEFMEAKYPHFRERHGKFWDEVRAGDPKDKAVLPMFCQVCHLPCVFPTPETARIEVREHNGSLFSFCSRGCAWIFDHEPDRYSVATSMDRTLNGLEVSELQARMGTRGRLGGLLDESEAVLL
jgi:phenol hydroxylase P3 protein